jgi:hypothetical protein
VGGERVILRAWERHYVRARREADASTDRDRQRLRQSPDLQFDSGRCHDALITGMLAREFTADGCGAP